jgi:predicted LPLAT superfamily acyltransferase
MKFSSYVPYERPFTYYAYKFLISNCIGGAMVSVLALSAVDRGFEPWSGQTKDYKICIFCFSAKHAALRRMSKDWLARNQNNVSEWSDMSIHKLLFQLASTIKNQLSVLV